MSQNIIILEGGDCTGKSEIARELKRIFGFETYRPTRQDVMRQGTQIEKIKNQILEGIALVDILSQSRHSLVFDRYYPSEWVYSKVFQRPQHLEELTKVDEAFASIGAKIVICFKTNFSNYSDDIIPIEKCLEINKTYIDFSLWTRCFTSMLDTTAVDLNLEIAHILGILN